MKKRLHVVELVRPEPEMKPFDRGERLIVVDGERWGRTIINHNGMHGVYFHFGQFTEGQTDFRCSVLEERPGTKYPGEIRVRSMRKRRMMRGEVWRPTEELCLEKAKELVANGRLRHPKFIRQLNERRHRRWRKEQQEKADARQIAFKLKAAELLQVNDPEAEIVSRCVEAMNWACDQP